MKIAGATLTFNGNINNLKPGDVITFTDMMGVEQQKIVKKVEDRNTIWVMGNKLAEAADLLRNRFYFDLIYKEERVVGNG